MNFINENTLLYKHQFGIRREHTYNFGNMFPVFTANLFFNRNKTRNRTSLFNLLQMNNCYDNVLIATCY